MKKLLSLILVVALLCGCTDTGASDSTTTTTSPQTTTTPVSTDAIKAEENDLYGFKFTAPDGTEINLSDESYYTFTLDGVYGYDNLGYMGEERPDNETLDKREYNRYNVDDSIGSFKVTYAKSTFSVTDGDTPSLFVQELTLTGEGNLKGILTTDEHGTVKFYPYPESLKELKIPCFYNRDDYSVGDFISVLQPDGTRKFMNTMEFSVTLNGETIDSYAEDNATEITIKATLLKFSTDGIKGYTLVNAEATEIIK